MIKNLAVLIVNSRKIPVKYFQNCIKNSRKSNKRERRSNTNRSNSISNSSRSSNSNRIRVSIDNY